MLLLVSLLLSQGLSVSRELAVFSIAIIVGFLAIMRLLLEVFEFFTLRIRYLFDWLNYLEVILYGSTIVFIFIFLEPCYCPRSWQWQIGAVVVFLAWIDLISRIRKLPLTGIYVLMFINIFYSFWKMAILSILLILSFSFSFYMLFNDPTITTGVCQTVCQSAFQSVCLSVCQNDLQSLFCSGFHSLMLVPVL